MNKEEKKALKNKYLEEQKNKLKIKSAHPLFQSLSAWHIDMQFATEITPEMVHEWNDDRLETSILAFVEKQLDRARSILGRFFTPEKELEVLNTEPDLFKYFFAITLFEQNININLTWNYFYQSGAHYAQEAHQGYGFFGNNFMQDFIWQGMGAYAKLQASNEIEEMMGFQHHWKVDYPKLIQDNTKDFDKLDKMVYTMDFEALQNQRIQFFRENWK